MLSAETSKQYAALLLAAGYTREEAQRLFDQATSGDPISAVRLLERKLEERGRADARRKESNLQRAINAAMGVTEEQYRKYYPLD